MDDNAKRPRVTRQPQRTVDMREPRASYIPESRQAGISPEEIEETRRLYGERLNIQLAVGNFDLASEIVEEARRDRYRPQQSLTPYLDVLLTEAIDDDVKLINLLEEYRGIVSVGDVYRHPLESLAMIPNVAWRSINKLVSRLGLLAAQRDQERERLARRVAELEGQLKAKGR